MRLYCQLLLLLLYVMNSNSKKVEINCNYHGFNSCNIDNPGTTCCNIKDVLNIYSEHDEVEIKYNQPSVNQNVKGIYIYEKEVHYFPIGFDKIFEKTYAITVKKSKLMKIASENLRTFPDLKYLDLSYNSLVILERDLFANNRKLQTMWLNNNNIAYISSSAFSAINKNKAYLNIQDNYCYHGISDKHSNDFENLIRNNTCMISDGLLMNETDKCTENPFFQEYTAAIGKLKSELVSTAQNCEKCRTCESDSNKILEKLDKIQKLKITEQLSKANNNHQEILSRIRNLEVLQNNYSESFDLVLIGLKELNSPVSFNETALSNTMNEKLNAFKNDMIIIAVASFVSLLIITLILYLVILSRLPMNQQDQKTHKLEAESFEVIDDTPNRSYSYTKEPVYQSQIITSGTKSDVSNDIYGTTISDDIYVDPELLRRNSYKSSDDNGYASDIYATVNKRN